MRCDRDLTEFFSLLFEYFGVILILKKKKKNFSGFILDFQTKIMNKNLIFASFSQNDRFVLYTKAHLGF